jgi:hypothetical protein
MKSYSLVPMPGGVLNKDELPIFLPVFSKLAAQNRLTPQALVDTARPDISPIHPFYEWDDSIAGEQYRLEQARSHVRCVRRVENTVPIKDQPIIREYHSVRDPDSGTQYQPLRVVARNPLYYQQVLADAKTEIRAWRAKYASLNELFPIISAIDDTLGSKSRPASRRSKASRLTPEEKKPRLKALKRVFARHGRQAGRA